METSNFRTLRNFSAPTGTMKQRHRNWTENSCVLSLLVYPIEVGIEEFDLRTVSDDDLQVVLGVARSDRHPVYIVHLAQVPHYRLWAREQLSHVAKEAVFPTQAQTQS